MHNAISDPAYLRPSAHCLDEPNGRSVRWPSVLPDNAVDGHRNALRKVLFKRIAFLFERGTVAVDKPNVVDREQTDDDVTGASGE